MESQRTAEQADSPKVSSAADQTAATSRDLARGRDGWLATPMIASIAVVCCAGPLLLGALAASAAGAWLAAHGYTLGAAALVALAALLAWRISAQISRG